MTTKRKRPATKAIAEGRIDALREWVRACKAGRANPSDATIADVEFLLGQLDRRRA